MPAHLPEESEDDDDVEDEMQLILKMVNENHKINELIAMRMREEKKLGERPSLAEVLSGQHEVMRSEFSKILRSKEGIAGLASPTETVRMKYQNRELQQANSKNASINKMKQFFKT